MFIFRIQRITAVILYLFTINYSMWFYLMPVFKYYGGWTVLYTALCLFIAGFLSTYMFFSAKRPQATQRPFATKEQL